MEIASDKQASDIILLDVNEVCNFASYFVIFTVESQRQMKAVLEDTVADLKKDNEYPLHREGTVDSGWILLDYGDVIVHMFASEEREYYKLEEIWGKAVTVVRIQ